MQNDKQLQDLLDTIPEMSKSQKGTIKALYHLAVSRDMFGDTDRYEFKKLELSMLEDSKTIQFLCETGLIGDENTMASILARNTRQIFVGKKGGVSAYKFNEKNRKVRRLNGWTQVSIYGRRG